MRHIGLGLDANGDIKETVIHNTYDLSLSTLLLLVTKSTYMPSETVNSLFSTILRAEYSLKELTTKVTSYFATHDFNVTKVVRTGNNAITIYVQLDENSVPVNLTLYD